MKDKHKKNHPSDSSQEALALAGKQGGDLPAPMPEGVEALRLGKDCDYDKELRRLQVELVKLQEWVRVERPARGGAL